MQQIRHTIRTQTLLESERLNGVKPTFAKSLHEMIAARGSGGYDGEALPPLRLRLSRSELHELMGLVGWRFATDHAAWKTIAFPDDAVILGRSVRTARALVRGRTADPRWSPDISGQT